MSSGDYFQRLLLAVGIIAGGIGLILFLWATADVLMLLFLGILLAIVLRVLTQPLIRYTPLPPKAALLVVLLLLVALGIGSGFLFVPEVLSQTDELVEQLDEALNQIQQILSDTDLPGDMSDDILNDENGALPNVADVLAQIADNFAAGIGAIANILFIVFTGLFVAADPNLYRSGLIHLIPPSGRARAREVIDEIVQGLKAWMLGRVISMVIVAIVISIGLGILGIPLALALGVLSGLLEFVPVVGPLLSAVPGVLIAFTLGPMQAVSVALVYLVVQQLEGNLLTPIVQMKTVALPPAVTLTAILAMGILFGILGVLVATPLATVGLILIQTLYVRDVLKSSSA